MDAQGYVRIVGRIKDMIIRGGENVYPAEVESFLMRHPAIRQAQVVGVPDPYMGEEAAAFVQLRERRALSEDELRDHCRANMSRHKLPKYFRFVDDVSADAERQGQEVRAARPAGRGARPRTGGLHDATRDLPLLYEKEGAVATFTLNRPAARNALTPELVCRLADAVVDFVGRPCAARGHRHRRRRQGVLRGRRPRHRCCRCSPATARPRTNGTAAC